MPKASVIITTFQRPQFLRESIESVLNQNFRDFELIVVNDDPASAEVDRIVTSFKDPRLSYVKNRENLGSAKSLNVGLTRAKGEYVAILDDDDVWLSPGKLDKQIAFLEKNPEYVLVGMNVIVVDAQSGREIVRSRIPAADEELRKLFFKSNPFAHSSVLFRRDVVLAVGGYDEGLPRGKDYDLWLKLAKRGKTAVLPDYFLKYREAAFRDRNVVEQRYKDAKWTLEVMRRHRNDFPHTLLPYVKQWVRYFIFKVLVRIPVLYRVLKTLKNALKN